MKAVFVELPAFARHRARYLDDEDFAAFQLALMQNPLAGDVIQGTGGCARSAGQIDAGARANVAACALSTTGGTSGTNI